MVDGEGWWSMARRGVQDGRSALFVAAMNQHIDVLNVLLDAQADMNARSKVRRVGGGSQGQRWGRVGGQRR